MATKQTGMTVETAAMLPTSRSVIAQEVSRALTQLADDAEDDDENELELTPADRIVAMLQSDLGDRAYVRVYRFDDRTGQRTFCKDYTPSEFESNGYELVRNDWGPGKYAVVIYGNQPGSKLFGIRGREELLFANPIRAAVVPTAPPQNDMMAQILLKITEGQERIIQALAAPQNQKSAREELKETLELMALMRPPETQKSSIGEIVEAIKEMKGVSDLIGGGNDKEPSMMSMASEVLSVVKPMIEQRAQQQPHQVPASPFPQLAIPSSLNAAPIEPRENPIHPISDGAQPLPDQPDMDDPDMLEFLAFSARLKKQVIPLAGDDSKVIEVAELLDEKAPDQLIELLQQDNWLEMFTQFAPTYFPALVPVIANNAPWLTKVRDHLLTLLKDED